MFIRATEGASFGQDFNLSVYKKFRNLSVAIVIQTMQFRIDIAEPLTKPLWLLLGPQGI